MLRLRKQARKLHQHARKYYICGKRILESSLKVKMIEKLEIIAITQTNIEVHHIVFAI